eukprot:s719_g3.t1
MELVKVREIKVETLISCRIDSNASWIPHVKEVSGVRLMLLSKWDRGFTKFLTGKSLNLNKGGMNLNSTPAGAYLEDLVRQKREACQEVVQKAHESEEHGAKAKGKKRKVTITDDMACFAPLVWIKLPAVSNPYMAERPVQVEFGSSQELWMEVNETSLAQVVHGIAECSSKRGRARTNKLEKAIKAEPVKKEVQEISESPEVKLLEVVIIHLQSQLALMQLEMVLLTLALMLALEMVLPLLGFGLGR